MRDLVHTGDSSNIAYYAEYERGDPRRTQSGGFIWAEVLRNDYQRSQKNAPAGPGNPLVKRERPEFHIRVNRIGQGEIASRTYIPRNPVPPGRLDAKAATRLVRAMLKDGEDCTHHYVMVTNGMQCRKCGELLA